MIDPHVHLRDWEQMDKETLAHGLKIAKEAGFQSLFDMPNTKPVITSRSLALDRLADASQVVRKLKGISYHLYMGLTEDEGQISEVVGAVRELFPLLIGLKLFAGQSTGNMGVVSKEGQKKVFKTLTSLGYTGVVAVHAEKESLLLPGAFIPGAFETHFLARPAQSEIESVRDLLASAKETGFAGYLHFCHISTKGAISLILDEQKNGMRIGFGVTPHHALLSSDDAKDPKLYLKINPPLRGREDQEAVYNSLLDGSAAWVESDHAPHTLADKKGGASGIPGFAGMLLLYEKLRREGVSKTHLSSLFGGNVQKVFALAEEEITLPNVNEKLVEKLRSAYPFDPYASITL